MLVAVAILALYFWAYFSPDVANISSGLLVGDVAAIIAGLSLIAGFVAYLWAPENATKWASLTVFMLLIATVSVLVLDTGGTSSPFIALWMMVAVFAGVFGMYGLLPLFLAVTAYMLYLFGVSMLSRSDIIAIVLMGELPLLVSYLIWHQKTSSEGGGRAYKDLATELSEVAGKSEVVINAIADGVIALNSQGVVQLINPAAQQIIGWGKQDALSLDYKSVIKLSDKKDAEVTPANDPVAQAINTNKEVTTNDLTLTTTSGRKRLVSVIVSPVGQPGAGVIIVFRDITKEKKDEREQAEFISTASHEMRTPVASIEGYLGLVMNPATAQIDDKAREYIGKAQEAAQHLGRLFQDLLDVSRAEDGRLSNNPKVVDVVAYVHDVMQGLRPKAEEKGLHFVFKPLPEEEVEKQRGHANERRLNPVYYANIDNDHLREVTANLIENAIKYTPKGDVVVDVTGDSEHITISVADSGIGVPKEDQAHLFQKFYRVDNSQTREIGGTGLGLYLCRRLAETMGGRIWMESIFGQGSTFFMELPRISHEEATKMIEQASIAAEQQEIQPEHHENPFNQAVEPAAEEQFTPAPVPQPIQMSVAQQPPSAQAPPQPQPATEPAPVLKPAPEQSAAPQPTAVPPQPTPAPVTPTPAPAANPWDQPAPAPAPKPYYPPRPKVQVNPHLPDMRPNTPLSSIEKDPNTYVRARNGNMSVPPRN